MHSKSTTNADSLTVCRQLQSAKCELAAVTSLNTEQFPYAQPDILMSIIQELHNAEQDIEFQAAMGSNIHALEEQTRSASLCDCFQPVKTLSNCYFKHPFQADCNQFCLWLDTVPQLATAVSATAGKLKLQQLPRAP